MRCGELGSYADQRRRGAPIPCAGAAGAPQLADAGRLGRRRRGGRCCCVFPLGFPNYDTIYALVWGRELAHGVSPDYGAALPPTPHPLADLLGLVTTPLGDGAITVTMVDRLRSRWAWSATSSTGSARSGSTARSAPSPR